MAIETTYIYSTDNSGLLAWLQANAVPKYFDRVEADEETPSTIYCYIGSFCFVTISIVDGNYKDISFAISNKAGTTTKCSDGTTITYYAVYGYKTDLGLAIGVGSPSSATEFIPIVITKDSSGNTTVVSSSAFNKPYDKISAITADDTVVNTVSYTQATDATATTIVPFVCGCVSACRYTPNAFYMPTAQYSGIGKLMIDGVAYLSNGAWLLKDK